MELLERDGALAALAQTREAAAGGHGRVVLEAGEAGIGKTALVTRFLRDLDAGARVLVGRCDDLAIPRPLGPVRDLVGDVSSGLAEAWYCSRSISRTNANSSRLTVGLRRCAWDTACWT